jgi:transposase
MKELSMEVLNPRSAGIDVGSRFHMVAVGQKPELVKKFGIYTEDHRQLIDWLTGQGVRSIAMESTGSYWQTLFDALQEAGFEVILVNGSQVKNVKGKKTDVLDCMWIQKLHSLGLLSASFLPASELQKLRTYYNHRQHLVGQISRYINKMQKSMRLMNIRLDTVLNDVMGKSGRAIIEAILAGERDTRKLSMLANYRVKKSKEEIAKSLEGNWREDLLFELRDCLYFHDLYSDRIAECDKLLEQKVAALAKVEGTSLTPDKKNTKQASKHSPAFDVQKIAHQYFGVDLFNIGGVSHTTVLCLLTNMGNDIHRFPSHKHYCSWLRLSPNNKISGGKVLSSRTPKGKNRIALAIRQAANSVGNQKNHPLTPFFRRVAFRKGRGAAVTATARKLATIIYNMITKREDYQPFNFDRQNQSLRAKQIQKLKSKLSALRLSSEETKALIEDPTISMS